MKLSPFNIKEKGLSIFLMVVFLFLTCTAFIVTRQKLESINRQKIPGSSIIYIPSGKHLKYATFGYNSLLADLFYIWAIQYYSDTSITDRFEYLDHIFSIISELDPNYLDPYQIGALIAIYEANDFELGLEFLDRGLINNPKQWILPFEAAHYAQLVKKDYKLAQRYYKKTMEIEGSPPIVQRLYANAAFKLTDYSTSWKLWLEIYNGAEDERIKKIASNHLYQVKAARDIEEITKALEEFKIQYSRLPQDLNQLVRAGYLRSLPKDFDNQDYVYDPDTGEVKPATIPWKR